jgi:DNA polymerase elongation subunit (family B)
MMIEQRVNSYGRSEIIEIKSGVVKTIPFLPYFFVLETEKETAKKFGKTENGFISIDSEKLVKLTLQTSKDVPRVREFFTKTFESRIPLTRRFIIDRIGKTEPEKLKVGHFDIETDDDTFPDIDTADKRIFCFTIWTDKPITWIYHEREIKIEGVRWFKTEREMLENFVYTFKNFKLDILTGWNLDKFDAPYVVNRLKRLGIKPNQLSPISSVYVDKYRTVVKGVILFDLLEGYKKVRYDKPDTYSLENIAVEEGLVKKIDVGKIRELWENEPEKLIEYNRRDCEILFELDKKRGIVDHFNLMSSIGCCSFLDVFNVSTILESRLMNKFKDIKFPVRQRTKEDKIIGAFVLEPIIGVHYNISIFDIISLYPSIIRTFNIDYTTYSDDGDIIIGDKRFKSSPRGLIPQLLDEIIEERKEAKLKMVLANKRGDKIDELKYNQLQNALKVLANGSYGVQLFPGFTLYKREVAETIPFVGQLLIKNIIKNIEAIK